jgi:hypothetical protein
MKFLKLFLFTALIVSITACSSDDDDGPVPVELTNGNLAGTYNITFLEGSSQSSVVTESGTNAIIVFSAAGTYTVSGNYRETLTVTVTGQSPQTEQEIVTLDTSSTYSTNNTNRTITFDDDTVNNVTLFDGTNLHFSQSYTETFESSTVVGEVRVRLVKQN